MNPEHKRNYLSYLLYGSLCAFLLIAGYRAGEYRTLERVRNGGTSDSKSVSTNPIPKPSEENISALDNNDKKVDFRIFWEAWDIFEKRFVDRAKLDPNKMFYNAVKGLITTGEDPYTFFLTPDENKQSKESLDGKFEGIGAQLGTKDGRIVVIAPIKNSPAIRAGIKAGDIITAVDGQATKGKSVTEVVSKIRGPAGKEVKLTIERSSKESVIPIRRAQIQVDSIELSYTGTYAHLRLTQFGTTIRTRVDKSRKRCC